MPTLDPERDLAALAALQTEMDSLFATDPAALARVARSVSGWSREQHLAHVALANELVLRNLRSLAAGAGPLVVHGATSLPLASEVLARGVLPRGEAQAPRMVRPPERIDRALLAQWLADGRTALAALDPRTLHAGGAHVPHQLLGPLDGPQWARFALVHTRHHLGIVAEIAAALAAEAQSPT
jgi:hypothetical protein